MAYLPNGMPLPNTEEIDTKDWWAACQRRELIVQQCVDCGTFRHPPVPVCHSCNSFSFKWTPVSGRGTVYSYIISHHPVHAALKGLPPYNAVVVELQGAGNVRMVGNLIDTPNDQVRTGIPVQVTWEGREGVILPQWRRA